MDDMADVGGSETAARPRLLPLRIPSGWMIGINNLWDDLDSDFGRIGGSSHFLAWNTGRRFKIEVNYEPEFDPEGSFLLTVAYQPWPRTDRGRRRKDLLLEFNADEEIVEAFKTRSYSELFSTLEQRIDRCSTWVREGN